MSETKPYTLAELDRELSAYGGVRGDALAHYMGDLDPARVLATVEALEKAEAEHLRLRNYVQTTLDCSYGETDGGIHCTLEVPCDKCRRERAEAERDEWKTMAELRYGGLPAADAGEAERMVEAARRSLSSVAEAMTEHAYQEIASALESPPRIAVVVPVEVHEHGWQWRPTATDTAFAPPFGTIRQCRVCGCLVAGGPTACARCAEAGS